MTGVETDVKVFADGTSAVIDREVRDLDDQAAPYQLDAATVESLVRTTLGAHEGRVVDVDVDDEAHAPFEVRIVTPSGTTRSLGITRDFRIIESDLDD